MSDRTLMWFKVIPRSAPNADGEWVKVWVRTALASNHKTPWTFYETLVQPNQAIAAVSRVEPAELREVK